MNTQFPVVPQGYSASFFNTLLMSLRGYFNETISKDAETPRIILRAPNGKLFDVTVSNAGALVVTPTEKERV